MLDPLPRRYTVCSRLFLPRCHRPSPMEKWVGFPQLSRLKRLRAGKSFEVADISLCSGLQVCLPPRSSLPLRKTPAGQPGLLRPSRTRFVASPRIGYANRPKTGNWRCGDLHPARLRPCRLLLSSPLHVATQHADFPHCALPFASRQDLWDLSHWGDFRSVASHSIAVEQPESVVQPRPTPPLPAEALSFPSLRQMAPDLFLDPIFDVAEALARVTHREVGDPPP